jgi:ABC-type uncharacterized transport system auxiliary subunit
MAAKQRVKLCVELSLAASLTLVLLLVGCGSLPRTHYYNVLPPPPSRAAVEARPVLGISEFEVDAAYTDERIVYRTSAYRLDYYNYHLWSAVPSRLLTDYFRTAYQHSGLFSRVTEGEGNGEALALRGRVIAFEEVDLARDRWHGRIVLEIVAVAPTTHRVLWIRRYLEEEPLVVRNPDGLAAALSRALARIVADSAPELARLAAKRSAEPTPAASRASAEAAE